MSLEENKAIVQRFIEALNTHDLSAVDDVVSPDFVDHNHQVQGVDVIKQLIEQERKGFSDFHVTIEDIIAEGDKVWVLTKETATHTRARYEALRFILSQYVTTAASSSDIRIAKMMIDAAERYTPMEEKEQQELLLKASTYRPLFPRASIP